MTIGNTDTHYEVRFSTKAAHKRIVVTPGGVEVVAPTRNPLGRLGRRPRWTPQKRPRGHG